MTQYKYRAERWEVTYGVEAAYGESPSTGGTILATNQFGVFQDATLPNPRFEHKPYWFMNPDNRNYYIAYKGKATSSGSIGNIILLDGKSLFLPVADTIVHTGAPGAYLHTINETVNLKSFRICAVNYADKDVAPAELVRWFVGGKANRAKYHCEEGGMLMMSLEDIPFKMPYYTNTATSPQVTPWYDAQAAKQTFTYTCREPYYFSQGSIKVKLPILGLVEVAIPSVKNFSIDVSNGCEPKYYVATNDEKVPYQIYEGQREYKLSLSVDLVDADATWTKDSPFMELLNQGKETGTSTFAGGAFDIKFSKSATDYIEFITPANYSPTEGGDGAAGQGTLILSAPMNIGGQGIINVQMEMLMRNLKIVVGDDMAGGTYPI
jgi:hypothetical protein